MMIFILMSGLFTAIENMPDWAMIFNKLNPVAYFIRVMRMVLLKGSGFSDIVPEIVSLSVLMMISLSVATWRYRKTT
jgi:ABC-2 type transport system permease protein